jgi:signal transduction histidine kinase
MNRLPQNRLVLQLVLTSAAALALSAISVLLIGDAVRNAEGVVLGEANRMAAGAVRELKEQYQYRVSSDSAWQSLPAQARDVSLRGITQTVLRSYPGVEGGFYAGGSFLGYAFPTHDAGASKTDVPSAERELIVATAERSAGANTFTAQVIRGKSDLLVLAAEPAAKGGPVVWTMKRLAGRAASGAWRRELLLSILAAAALASVAGSLATGLSLARGVAQIRNGLWLLERDFEFRLPERSDELGVISRSVNQMARVRGKLELELRREDRLRALGRFTAGIAHEIRNPLNSISLTVQLLERRLETDSIRREDLRTVRTEVERLGVLLNDLLDLKRSRQPRPQWQAILPVLRHCVGLVKQQACLRDVTVRLEEASEDISGFFDAQQLTQTIVNLLLNALEASPKGGVVQVYSRLKDGRAQVQVDDEGPGLGVEQQEHLFEAFYTTKPAGSGLGLAVSRELMRSQGGDLLYVASEAGARFVVELPETAKSPNAGETACATILGA